MWYGYVMENIYMQFKGMYINNEWEFLRVQTVRHL